jgi:hypothetical protein
MRLSNLRVRIALSVAVPLIAVAVVIWAVYQAAYQAGYRAGLSDNGPQHRALVVIRREKANPSAESSSCVWFDVSKPGDAARLRAQEARLKAANADYYVAKGRVETYLELEPDPRRANSHR